MEATPQINISGHLIAGVIIILLNGFFVAVEFALVTSRRMRLQQAARQGSASARIVLKMLENPDRAYAAAQLGVTAASILLGIVAEEPIAELLNPILIPILGRFLTTATSVALASGLVLLILSFFHMVIGEQAPKLVAIRHPERVAQFIAYPMRIFSLLTAPFVWVVDRSTAVVLRLVGMKDGSAHHGTFFSVDELKAIMQQSSQEGLIEENAREMLDRVFNFGNRVVREVMVPRPNIIGIDREQNLQDLLLLFKEHRHSRFPIYTDNLDHVVGIIAIKDLLAFLAEHPQSRDVLVGQLDLIQEAMMVPESRKIDDLFAEMRGTRTGLAIVIDEFGGTAGLVTIEELVEEVVGTITDDWATQPVIRQLEDHIYEVDAQLRVDEINDALGTALPEADEYETVAGLILHQLRRIPTIGYECHFPTFSITVLEMDGPKITKVRIQERV
ncbi:MAG: HlyC/CorC family transporter [Chloroflexi bacterium]|nr:HlyC/CorC family transporter [Chloroflexota bacterium]